MPTAMRALATAVVAVRARARSPTPVEATSTVRRVENIARDDARGGRRVVPRARSRARTLARAVERMTSYDERERVRITTSMDEDEVLFEFDADAPEAPSSEDGATTTTASSAVATVEDDASDDAENAMDDCLDVVTVNVDDGKRMLERESYVFVDCRSWKEYDRQHITKPPQQTINVPLADGDLAESWAKRATEKTRPSMKLLIADADGARARELTKALQDQGYANCVAVEGGYEGWTAKYTTFGRPVPPKGRFVSTGKEALKSGLDLDDTVAAAYEENWGKAPPKYGAEST